MKKVLVCGAGLVAGPLVRYFIDRPDYSVIVADMEVERARRLVAGHPRGEARALSVEDRAALMTEIRRADLVVSMVPYVFHPVIAAAAIEAGRSVVTASYVSPAMRELDGRAREKGVIILNELGLDPGIDHMEAMRIIHEAHTDGGRVLAFTSWCGGLPAPEANTNPFGYKFSWSPRGVLLASKNQAKYLKDGRVVVIPAERLFAEPEVVAIPGLGEFEGYPNRDSLSYREVYGIPEAGTVFRGTLRNAGWCRTLMKMGELGLLEEAPVRDWTGRTYRDFLGLLVQAPAGADVKTAVARRLRLEPGSEVISSLDWLGLFANEPLPVTKGSALDILAARMIERLVYAPGERDMVILRHEFLVEGRDGRKERVLSSLIDYGIPDGDSSMSRLVGLPAATGARMILEGRIRETGVRVPVTPDIYNPILDELAGLGVRFEERREFL
ncbi:MAG TPA: saccharopine dehydrogenase C-terminal domain-containing protein [Burkholderiales bacterium]|nr:saccharopine dehydrogenase C-terminal domain-containing protein [Burkholderiales bacterium]